MNPDANSCRAVPNCAPEIIKDPLNTSSLLLPTYSLGTYFSSYIELFLTFYSLEIKFLCFPRDEPIIVVFAVRPVSYNNLTIYLPC